MAEARSSACNLWAWLPRILMDPTPKFDWSFRERKKRGKKGVFGFVLFCSSCLGVQIQKRKKERRKGKVLVWVDSRASKRDVKRRRGGIHDLGVFEKVESNDILGTGNRRNRNTEKGRWKTSRVSIGVCQCSWQTEKKTVKRNRKQQNDNYGGAKLVNGKA